MNFNSMAEYHHKGGLIMDIEKRLTNLENLVYSFIKSQSRTDDYKTADINGCRHTDSEQQTSIDTNTNDISDNIQGLTETFEATLTNTDDVAINRQAIVELFEMISAESEVK